MSAPDGSAGLAGTPEDPLEELAEQFWVWRARHAPHTRDDIPRIGRPSGWRPSWSTGDVARKVAECSQFSERLSALEVDPGSGERYTDARLLATALARVRFELEVLAPWRKDPAFYLDQTLGTVFDLLLPAGPFDEARCGELLVRVEAIPRTLADAEPNLASGLVHESAGLALGDTARAGRCLEESVALLGGQLSAAWAGRLSEAAAPAVRALDSFHAFVEAELGRGRPLEPLGRDALCTYLYEVALLPFSPEELLAMGRQEWDRSVAFELFEQHRSPSARWPELPADAAAQAEHERLAELEVRAFYTDKDLLSQPAELGHYRNLPRPAYLEPLAWLGVTDDLTGPGRLEEDGVSYVPVPSDNLPYFYRANAADPRAGIVHEGAHYQQLALSWRHERPARRHYYDSCANEGIAFYNEELLTQAGLFDQAPVTRRIIYSFLRLRALRVEIDLRLALGDWSIPQAADALARRVPVDPSTAEEEAVLYAANPGLGLSYLVGKTQLLRLLADARERDGESFSLRAFHDWLWRNGNVPFALLRLELLGDSSDLDRIERLAGTGSGAS